MKTIIFRPLRKIKKTGKITVASYMQWNKVRTANYSYFNLNVISDYTEFNKSEFVYNHLGESLYHYNYNPWHVFTYNGTCLDKGFDWDFMYKEYRSFSIDNGGEYIARFWRGADCAGTPIFTHLTADSIADNFTTITNVNEFEPITVGYVLDWLGWFLYNLEKSNLKVIK
jgi:hypothetical protein